MDRSFQQSMRIGIWLLVLCLVTTPPMAADRPRKEMRESATLPADKNLLKQFRAIEDYLAEKRWTEVIDLLQQIVQTDGRLLVRAQPGVAGESTVYLNVAARCNILLSQLPPEGLAIYRKKIDPQARRWLDRWKLTHDEADLLRIVHEAYLSSLGDEALWALGESAWDRGDLASARQYWTQLCPLGKEAREQALPTVLRYPDSDLNVAEVLARLVLCTLMEGERDRAVSEHARFQELYPDAKGTLAGRNGLLSDLLAQILDESANWDLRAHAVDMATFGLNPNRDGLLESTIEIGASKWSHPLPATQLKYPDRHNSSPDRGPLSYYPATFEDIVLVNDSRSIWAWNLVTGEAAWPTERGTAEIYPPAPDEMVEQPDEFCNGVPYYTMTVADGRLYARMGSAVTNPGEKETHARDSDLVCLDLAHGQGKLVWKVTATELFKSSDGQRTGSSGNNPGAGGPATRPEDNKWRFEGSPLVMGGRAYMALSRRLPQFDFAIACLDAATGTLLWHRTVVYARGTVEDHQNRISHLLLTAGAGKLFLSTDAGAIVAVDARDGRLAWAVTYESIVRKNSSLAFSNHLQLGLLPPMFHEGLLFVAPNDCSRVFCIEADSGRVRWQHKHPDPESNRWRHLLGVARGGDAGRLIVSGRGLSAIDIATNKATNWMPTSTLGGSSSEAGYGRGIVAGNVILWPTREAIKVVDSATGQILENKPLHTPAETETGGNLTVSQGMLLVAQPYRLVAYCEYSLLKQKLERELSRRSGGDLPKTPIFASSDDRRLKQLSTAEVLGQLADIEYAQGNADAAVAVLQKAIAADAASDQPDAQAASRSRARLLEIHRVTAKAAASESNWVTAVERLVEARKLATQPADIVEILVELAEAEAALSRPVVAADYLQQILDSDQLRNVTVEGSTAGSMANSAISRLIQKRGRVVYHEIEHRASSEISGYQQANDSSGLRHTLERYPNSEAAFRTWRQLAAQDRAAGQFQSALFANAHLQRSELLKDHAAVLVDWADTLEAAGYWRPARAAWKQLASNELADQILEFDQSKRRVISLASQRLENPAYKSYEPREVQSARYLNRSWSIPLPKPGATSIEGPTVLIPRNEPPAPDLACLLVQPAGRDAAKIIWECIDRTTGRVRWQRTMPSTPQWVAYAETHLLLASQTHLLGLSLETGADLWAIPLTRSSVSTENPIVVVDEADARDARSVAAARTASVIQVIVRDHWVLLFDAQSGVTVADARIGKVAWTFKPPRGRIQPNCVCGTHCIALQTLQPAVTWLIDIAADCQSTERPGAAEPWLQAMIDDDALVTISPDRRIEYRSTSDGRSRWRYGGGMSFAHANPVIWSAGKQLLLTVDGTTLANVDPLTGRTQWSAGIADRPLINPATQVIASADAAFAASQGSLRRVSLKYGECQWERFLGSAADQWRVADCHGSIAAWPSTRATFDSSGRQFVVWCDSRTGRILQQMNVAKGDRVADVSADGSSCLVVTDQSIVAFRAAPDR